MFWLSIFLGEVITSSNELQTLDVSSQVTHRKSPCISNRTIPRWRLFTSKTRIRFVFSLIHIEVLIIPVRFKWQKSWFTQESKTLKDYSGDSSSSKKTPSWQMAFCLIVRLTMMLALGCGTYFPPERLFQILTDLFGGGMNSYLQ